jgi:hypothetical protein
MSKDEVFADRLGNKPTVPFDDVHGTRIKMFTNKTAKGEFDNVVETGSLVVYVNKITKKEHAVKAIGCAKTVTMAPRPRRLVSDSVAKQ